MKLSVNVSVHTTDKALRARMLGNPNAGEALKYLYMLAEAGAELNCQVVICPGINDGESLDKTLKDLTALNVSSIACVPVGLTKHRGGLTPLTAFTKETAQNALDIIAKHDAYASDELFILAGQELPDYDYYGDFPQYENGVGMLRLLISQFTTHNAQCTMHNSQCTIKKSIATGVLAAPYIQELVGANVQVYAIRNDFFGHSVTVSGLVTGGDLINQLRGQDLGEELLIPANMLRADEDVFLDDVTVADVEKALGVSVRAVNADGAELRRNLWL
jgi:putative radical SAM enzyme (TIGR03279 family)